MLLHVMPVYLAASMSLTSFAMAMSCTATPAAHALTCLNNMQLAATLLSLCPNGLVLPSRLISPRLKEKEKPCCSHHASTAHAQHVRGMLTKNSPKQPQGQGRGVQRAGSRVEERGSGERKDEKRSKGRQARTGGIEYRPCAVCCPPHTHLFAAIAPQHLT